MKFFCVLVTLLSISLSAFASRGKVLLDCNLSGGDNQQVVVEQDGAKLYLKELTMRGRWQERTLDESEWASKAIQISARFGQATLRFEDGEWFLTHVEPGFRYMGFADCR